MKRREYTVAATRVYDAPRERVFACWTRAEHIAGWFAPAGFSVHDVEADPRPGGVFRMKMRAPWGDEYPVYGTYVEVAAPERLVIECRAGDEQGVEQLDEVIRVEFAAEGRGTRLTLRAVAGGTTEKAWQMLDGMERGWNETLDRLAEQAATATAARK